jgi:hypothetical protein
MALELGTVDVVAYEAQHDLACLLRLSLASNAFVNHAHFLVRDCYLAGLGQESLQTTEICAFPLSRGASRLQSEKLQMKAYAGPSTYMHCTNVTVCQTIDIPFGALSSYKLRMVKIDSEVRRNVFVLLFACLLACLFAYEMICLVCPQRVMIF